MRKAPELPEGDDGRTFVDMNVEGMPWYHRRSPDAENAPSGSGSNYEMTKEESRMYMWGALKAALTVALIFAVVFLLFILFCDKIWLK